MSVWALGVCQSRNWEAFSVDLRGQGLPKAPLQNNGRPGSWQWDTGAAALLGLPLKTHRPGPLTTTSLPLSLDVPSTGQDGKALRNWQREKAEAITLPIWSVWNVAMLYCMWTDTFVMSDTTTGRWEGLTNSSLIPTWEQELNCLQYDTSRVWFIVRMQSTAHTCMIHLEDLLLCICQHWMS